MNETRHSDAGLTLIEVLVSLAIFAVIGVAGLTVLNTVARTGERTDGRLERLAEIDRAFLVIRRDLAQIEPSDTRLADDILRFQRLHSDGSWKVTYRLDDTTLIREISLDTTPPVAQQMLAGVASMEWRLMDSGRQMTDRWPVEGAPQQHPKAAELMLDVWREGRDLPQRVTRLFPLPAGQGR
jgi:general secretion pathway protein J